MSIWVSFFDLDRDHPLGPPYEVDYPAEDMPPPTDGWFDLAHPMGGFPQGWVRLSVDEAERPDRQTASAQVMLSPAQVRALHEALGTQLFDGSRDE